MAVGSGAGAGAGVLVLLGDRELGLGRRPRDPDHEGNRRTEEEGPETGGAPGHRRDSSDEEGLVKCIPEGAQAS